MFLLWHDLCRSKQLISLDKFQSFSRNATSKMSEHRDSSQVHSEWECAIQRYRIEVRRPYEAQAVGK